MRKLTPRDLRAYDRGAMILARGSGSATPFSDAATDESDLPALVSAGEIDGYIATVVKLGATGTTHDWGASCARTLDALLDDARLTRSDLAAIAPGEINRSQVDRALHVAHTLGKPLLDADHVGATAVPTLSLCRSIEHGLPLRAAYEIVRAEDGALKPVGSGVLDCGSSTEAARDLDAQLRRLTLQGGVAAALFLTRDTSLLFHGSISRTITLGACIGEHPVRDILRFTEGVELGVGTLDRVVRHPGTGFASATVEIGPFTVGVLNEFLFVEREGEVIASVPAIVALVDDAGTGILTARLERFLGRRVHVLALPEVDPTGLARKREWDRLIEVHRASTMNHAR